MILRTIVLLALLAACGGAQAMNALPDEGDVDPTDRAALQAAVAAACGHKVVLMGEASHGGGHSEVFKVALLTRLVTHCGFDTVLFEASFYEFTPISRAVRAKRPVDPALVAAAVGGLWKFDREVQPLFTFLASRAQDGLLRLGGLDFQPGGFEQPYSNGEMFFELIVALSAARRAECTTLYDTAIDGDEAPDGMSRLARVEALHACLSDGATVTSSEVTETAEQREMNAHRVNLAAWLTHLDRSRQALVRARDKMMAENVVRHMGGDDHPSKVLVWTHNGHAAKTVSPMRATYAEELNLGTALAEKLGERLFALGITARSGTYRWSPGTNKAVPQPSEDALESHFDGGKTKTSVFVPKADLLATGERPAGFLGYEPVRADWARAFDGIIILDAEYPPHRTRP